MYFLSAAKFVWLSYLVRRACEKDRTRTARGKNNIKRKAAST